MHCDMCYNYEMSIDEYIKQAEDFVRPLVDDPLGVIASEIDEVYQRGVRRRAALWQEVQGNIETVDPSLEQEEDFANLVDIIEVHRDDIERVMSYLESSPGGVFYWKDYSFDDTLQSLRDADLMIYNPGSPEEGACLMSAFPETNYDDYSDISSVWSHNDYPEIVMDPFCLTPERGECAAVGQVFHEGMHLSACRGHYPDDYDLARMASRHITLMCLGGWKGEPPYYELSD
jgi:hypothetical protein